MRHPAHEDPMRRPDLRVHLIMHLAVSSSASRQPLLMILVRPCGTAVVYHAAALAMLPGAPALLCLYTTLCNVRWHDHSSASHTHTSTGSLPAECLAYCFLELYLGDMPWRYKPDVWNKYALELATIASNNSTNDPLLLVKYMDKDVYHAFAQECALQTYVCTSILGQFGMFRAH
jgi:hypothetical protein